MADSEATIYIVDVAESMGQTNNGRKESDLNWSLKYVWDKITSTVFTARKTLQLGVIAIGTDDTNNELASTSDDAYDHLDLIQPIAQILMPALRELHKRLIPSSTEKRDALSAIILATHLLSKHKAKRKKIILVTNGTGQIDGDDFDETAFKLRDEGIELVVLGLDFDDDEYGFKEENKPKEKRKNEQRLRQLVEQVDGVFGTMQEAIEELSVPRIKEIKSAVSFKGDLRLGNPELDTAICISIERYGKVMKMSPPSASSFTLKLDGSSQVDGMASVRPKYTYTAINPTTAEKLELQREDLAKGYQYGRSVVHIAEVDENITKLETDASYEILGFIPAEKVERYLFLDKTSMLVAAKSNLEASIALSSLIHALFELESCIVAKFVQKDMVKPVLKLLSASIDADFECLIENDLPFAEDIRSYRFPPLDKVMTVSGKSLTQHRNLPNNDLVQAMSDFVDSMDLTQDGEEEDITVENTFSVIYHRIEDAIKYRAIHTTEPIPPVSEFLMKHSKPSETLVSRSQPALQRLIKATDVKKVPPKVKGRKRNRDTETPVSGLDVEALFRQVRKEKKIKISPENAIPEFKQTLAQVADVEVIKDAMKQMSNIVETQIKNSFADVAYGRALEGIGVMKSEMMDLEMPVLYNDMLRELKRKIVAEELGGDRWEMWVLIRKSRLGLITSDVAGVTEEEASKFMAWR